MKNKIPVTVVISAYNEEAMIEDCLKSVDWADEIILIDNSSTDKTATIAKEHNAKIFKKENNLMLNVNKNFGFSKATNDWVLSLDADERVSPELAEEILRLLEKNEGISGYWIPRKNIIFQKWIEHAGWYPDHQLRLFKKTKGKFPEQHVHEMILLEGEADYCKEHLIHYNYTSIEQFLRKTILIYAPNEAEQYVKNGYEFAYLDSIRFPLKEFLSRYFAREGYKDGLHGLMLSLLMAFYHFIIFAYLWEKQQFVTHDATEVLKATKNEGKRIKKEFQYWFLQVDTVATKNPYKKIIKKITNKFL